MDPHVAALEAPAPISSPAPKSILRGWLEALLPALVLMLLVRTSIAQLYQIPSGSMEDTLQIGDFLVAEKVSEHFRDYRAGDVLVFEYPDDPSKDFIKRVVATAGQTVEVRNKTVYVNGVAQAMPLEGKHVDPEVYASDAAPRDNYGPVAVPRDGYFMMGDNRDNSLDSRFWRSHFLDKRSVKGRAFFIYWSWSADEKAPQGSMFNPVVLGQSLLYNIVHFVDRARFGRMGSLVR